MTRGRPIERSCPVSSIGARDQARELLAAAGLGAGPGPGPHRSRLVGRDGLRNPEIVRAADRESDDPCAERWTPVLPLSGDQPALDVGVDRETAAAGLAGHDAHPSTAPWGNAKNLLSMLDGCTTVMHPFRMRDATEAVSRIMLTLTPVQKDLIQRAARHAGLHVTQWLRFVAVPEAERQLAARGGSR